MAILTPTLTLAQTGTIYSDESEFTVTDSLTIAAPHSGLSQVIATATGSDTIIVPASTAIAYLFVRHTGTTDGTTTTTQ